MVKPSRESLPHPGLSHLQQSTYVRATAFRDALMEAVDDVRKLDASNYRALRQELMEDPQTAELLPAVVRENEEPAAFCAVMAEAAGRTELRRRVIWSAFMPLLDALNQQRVRTRAPLSDAEKAERFSDSDATRVIVRSSGWTGTRTIRELCGIVTNLAPTAVAGIDELLAEQERRLHNSPPEPLAADALAALRDLRDALSDLLAEAERERPLGAAISGVQHALNLAFTLVRDTGELLVGGLPTLAASTVTGWGTFAICQLLVGLEGDASATMAAGAIAATVIETGRASRKKAPAESRG
ncbi:MAG: hypothetical protein JWO81_2626 [Alphaproteobacteria bacterium]|nr:hypothetical protein [Alphaproteobacteria bacterium]